MLLLQSLTYQLICYVTVTKLTYQLTCYVTVIKFDLSVNMLCDSNQV